MANNCASCHAASYRIRPTRRPPVVVTGPAPHLDLEAIFRFLVDCAKDPRFNADTLMREIKLVTNLAWIDRLIYRFLVIPITKKRLLEREDSSRGCTVTDSSRLGPGRDDAMNLTKYFMIALPDGQQPARPTCPPSGT